MRKGFILIAGLIAGALLARCAQEQSWPVPNLSNTAAAQVTKLASVAAPPTEGFSGSPEKTHLSPGPPEAEAKESETGVRVEFIDPIPKHDRQLVEFGIELAKPLFEAHGIPMRTTVYVVGDEEYFVSSDQIPEGVELKKYFFGWATPWEWRVVIYIPLINLSYGGEGSLRDIILLRVVIHELYHILQSDLTEGRDWELWGPEVPFFLREGAAHVAEFRGILGWFCPRVPRFLEVYGVVFADPISTPRSSECKPEFLQENIIRALPLIAGGPDDYLRHRYIITEFGVEAYDRYFAAWPEVALRTDGLSTWEAAFQDNFGMDLEEFDNRVFYPQRKSQCANCERAR